MTRATVIVLCAVLALAGIVGTLAILAADGADAPPPAQTFTAPPVVPDLPPPVEIPLPQPTPVPPLPAR